MDKPPVQLNNRKQLYQTYRRATWFGLILVVAVFGVGVFFSWWLSRAAGTVAMGVPSPVFILWVGIIFSIMLASLVGVSSLLRINTYRLAADLTADLEESRHSLALLISNLPGAAYRHENDPRMRLEYVSDGIEKLTGYGARDFMNARITFSELIVPGEKTEVWEKIQTSLVSKVPFEFVCQITHKDGLNRWISAKGRGVFDNQGQLLHVEGFLADVTDRYLTEKRLSQRALELEKLNHILVGRENKMAELKRQLEELHQKYGLK